MTEERTDYEVVEGQSMVLADRPMAISIPDVEGAMAAWQAYQELCKRLLDDSDHVMRKGTRDMRKRSGWTKLRRAFNISVKITKEEWEELGPEDYGYKVTVQASFPNGRFEDGDGYCDSHELRVPRKDGQPGTIEPTRHNVRAKAITRAKNRATSDIIGAGKVSAEEMPVARNIQSTKRKAKSPPTKAQKASSNGGQNRWQRFLQEHELAEKEALSALGSPSVTDWMKANPGKTEKDAHAEILSITGRG